jgi:hypothetical protein
MEVGTGILLEICAVHESAFGTKRTGALALPEVRCCRFCDFQRIHYECSPVLSWFFIQSSTLNHFTTFWRFKKFGYDHLHAARF